MRRGGWLRLSLLFLLLLLPAGAHAAPKPLRLPPIKAVLTPPVTTYSLPQQDLDSTPIKVEWMGELSCGSFAAHGYSAQWSHPDGPAPNCPHDQGTSHPGAIIAQVTGAEGQRATCQFQGSEAGEGSPCTVERPAAGAPGTGTAPAPGTGSIPGGSQPVTGLPVSFPLFFEPWQALHAALAILLLGGFLFGLPWLKLPAHPADGSATTDGPTGEPQPPTDSPPQPGGPQLVDEEPIELVVIQRCNCGAQERQVRERQLALLRAKRGLSEMEANLAAAKAALAAYQKARIEYQAAILRAQTYMRELPAKIAQWSRYLTLLKSLLGPLMIAGRDELSTTPQPGWIQVGPHLWASTEAAAKAIGPALAAMETLLASTAGGVMQVSVLRMKIAHAEQALQQCIQAYLWALNNLVPLQVELAKIDKRLADLPKEIESIEVQLPQVREAVAREESLLAQAWAELAKCRAAVYPNCPDPTLPPVNEIDVVVVDNADSPPAPPSPAPANPPEPPTTEERPKDEPPPGPEAPPVPGDLPPVITTIPLQPKDLAQIESLARDLATLHRAIKELEALVATGAASQAAIESLVELRQRALDLIDELTEAVRRSNEALIEAERKAAEAHSHAKADAERAAATPPPPTAPRERPAQPVELPQTEILPADQALLQSLHRELQALEQQILELQGLRSESKLDAAGLATLKELEARYAEAVEAFAEACSAAVARAKAAPPAGTGASGTGGASGSGGAPTTGTTASTGDAASTGTTAGTGAPPSTGTTAGTGDAPSTGTTASDPDPLVELERATQARRARIEGIVAGWLQGQSLSTEEPLYQALTAIATQLDEGALAPAFLMLQHLIDLLKRTGQQSALLPRLLDQLATTALAEGSLPALAGALGALTESGPANDPRLTQIRTALLDLLKADHPTVEIEDLDATELKEVASSAYREGDLNRFVKASLAALSQETDLKTQIEGLLKLQALLGNLRTLTGFAPEVMAAIAQTRTRAEALGAELQGALDKSLLAMEEASRLRRLYRRTLEKVEALDFDLTAEEEHVLDLALPDWRLYLDLDSIMQSKGTHAQPRLLPHLRRLVAEADRASGVATQELMALERIRLMLATGAMTAGERVEALASAVRTAAAEAESFARLLVARGDATSDKARSQLDAKRALSAAADSLSFSLDPRAIYSELNLLFRELNGHTDEVAPLERVHTDGAIELLEKSEAGSKARSVAEEWVAYLQQRRLSLLRMNPANTGVEAVSQALKAELNRDVTYWKAQRPWDELRWLTGETAADRLFQEATTTYIYHLPEFSRQVALAEQDPRGFIAFLTTLQREKVTRGDAAWEAYQETPLSRRGPITQSWRLAHAAENVEKMFADQRLLSALQYAASLPLAKIPEEFKALLRQHGFLETKDGQERLAIPREFRWAPSVGEQLSQRDWTDELFNLEHFTQMVATFYMGGWASGAVSGLQAARGASLAARIGWWAARSTAEATIFTGLQTAMNTTLDPSKLFHPELKSLLKEWLENAVSIGGLNLLGSALARLEEALITRAGAKEIAQVLQTPLANLTKADLAELLARLPYGATRLAIDAGAQTAVSAGLDHLLGGNRSFDLESFLKNVVTIGQLKAMGLLSHNRADELYRQARETGILINRARQAYERTLRELFASARSEGRTELNDRERAKLQEAAQQIESAAGGLKLTSEFRDIQRDLEHESQLRVGKANGGWRSLLASEGAQRSLFGGKTLLEALRTVDPGTTFAERYKTALSAAARFMFDAGTWVGIKGELTKVNPEVAAALFSVRKAWADYICKEFNATVIGTVKSMMNDCDFNFALGKEPGTFDPVPRMRAAAEWSEALFRSLLKDSLPPEKLAQVKVGDLFETNSYTDPAIIHLYTRAQLTPEGRAAVIEALTRSSLGLSRYILTHDLHLPASVTDPIWRAAQEGGIDLTTLPTPDEMARSVGVTEWHGEAGRRQLLERQSQLLGEYLQRPSDADVVRQICEIQMLLNAQAEGAYPTPGAALVTVTIKEGVESTEMRALKEQMKPLKQALAEGGSEAIKSQLAALEKAYEELRLATIRSLSPGEALQSVLGDLLFFWHMVHTASPERLDRFEATLRYELSKYGARLLEIGRLFGMDLLKDARFTGIARLLKITTQIYKDHTTGNVFAGPALANMAALREYFAVLEKASVDVIRYLAERQR